jgi:tetratricopeptide (TPR) repeat protein
MTIEDDVGAHEQSAPDLAENVRTFFIGLLAALVSVEILCAFASTSVRSGLVSFALSFTVSSAAGLSGGLLGFIFGIPRALTDGEAFQALGAKSKPNTNLEQISDWLTKILVGATLTSIASVPTWMSGLTAFFDAGQFKASPGGGTFIVALICGFFALGFFWSYIETRTFLTLLFNKFGSYGDGISDELLLRVRSAPWEPGSPPIPEDATVLRWDGSKLKTLPLLEARAAAETRAGNIKGAIEFYRRALTLDPANPRIQTRLSLLLPSVGKPAEADALIERLQKASNSNPAQQNTLEVNRLYSALYKPPPKGFQEAIDIGERLINSDQNQNGLMILWLACAYAQRTKFYAKNRPVNDPENLDRKRTLELVERALQLRPDLITLARSLWRPKEFGGLPNDNDLEVFSDDVDFKRLLGIG